MPVHIPHLNTSLTLCRRRTAPLKTAKSAATDAQIHSCPVRAAHSVFLARRPAHSATDSAGPQAPSARRLTYRDVAAASGFAVLPRGFFAPAAGSFPPGHARTISRCRQEACLLRSRLLFSLLTRP